MTLSMFISSDEEDGHIVVGGEDSDEVIGDESN